MVDQDKDQDQELIEELIQQLLEKFTNGEIRASYVMTDRVNKKWLGFSDGSRILIPPNSRIPIS